ncbi:tetraprenyl-beta-curcumene synthase family protein [Bacillus sp. WMMC1349]|uniref:tetraprenyl-beta-curcumene synthase family protein n=1 Tax=Bacillus sp. WMMC1349 TaxID=2736254 RepID=UPI0015542200|nr:tetraprenyl-beta-curcumene synthase family protein [Bacillus sp. WMMC1349]NPC93815.1 tetraprenyl-beta-curcumene synthase family protein [Bacillus sp. WMMC1349]
MSVPEHPFGLMARVYKDVFPLVHQELDKWRTKAESIENPELKSQALASLKNKAFHCEGGGIMALLSGQQIEQSIRFIIAYQTISDYLDNLCDRSTSLDPEDFSMLHQSMKDALTVGAELKNYYQFREDQNDQGYLHELVKTCQAVLAKTENYHVMKDYLHELCSYYCDLQVHKHVIEHERVPRLEAWFNNYKSALPKMEWYEFSACAGSTLGIFCLVSYSVRSDFTEGMAKKIRDSYFPYVQGLHILLDYLIDQEEDLLGGDLNFCTYYSSHTEMMERLKYFIEMADEHLRGIPHENFHRLINRGLLGVYLSDDKVASQKEMGRLAKKLIKASGKTSFFFYINGRAYRKLQKMPWNKSS